MKKNILQKAYKEKFLIGIRTSSLEWGESIIGFIIEIDDSFLIINEIDENGFLIGNTQIAIEDVFNIDIDDRYQKRLKFIYENNSKISINNRVTIWKEGKELLPYLKMLIENRKIATFFFNEDDYVTGQILKYDETYVMFENIGREGDNDGFSYYPLNALIGVRYDGVEEQKIEILHENIITFY